MRKISILGAVAAGTMLVAAVLVGIDARTAVDAATAPAPAGDVRTAVFALG